MAALTGPVTAGESARDWEMQLGRQKAPRWEKRSAKGMEALWAALMGPVTAGESA